MCKQLEKLHIKQVTDERAQNATPVEETPCNHSMGDPPNATRALKMRPLSRKRCVTVQKALRRRFLSKKPHLGAQDALCDPCRGNDILVLRRRFLSTKSHLRVQNATTAV